ncbi:MAG: hypothetical protein IKD78_11940 [Bacteroidales bacterium]|nr:hypothetical protein [Prevotella sp.]MBR2772697.1 hypothetical protein [Bacteroidales bacterium]
MEKQLRNMFLLGSAVFLLSGCTVSYINTDTLKQNYEKKIHHTTLLGKLRSKTDVRKNTFDHVQVFLNENEVQRNFEVTAYGSYTPLILPIIRPERPRLEKNLLWKAARKASKLNADGVIIDNKNDFRVIKFK